MGNQTSEYFNAMERFRFACAQHNYQTALIELRAGLGLTPAALTSMHQDFGGQPTVPFIESKGGAIAALFDDSESFDLMDSIMEMSIVTRKFDVARYRRDADVIAQARVFLRSASSLKLPELKTMFAAEDSARLSRLLGWMSKHGEITIEKVGKQTIITTGKPTQRPESVPPTLRLGTPPTETPLLVFTTRVLGIDKLGDLTASKEDIYPEYNRRNPDTEVEERVLPASLRQPSIMKTRVTASGSWLLARSKEMPDGTFTTLINRYLVDGTRIEPLLLTHRVSAAVSEIGRTEIVTIDPRLSIRTYDFSGALLASVSLWDNPEIRAVYGKAPVGTKETAIVRGIDMSAARQEVAFSIGDRCWVFRLDGEPILSFRLPAVPSGSIHLLGKEAPIDLQTALVAQGLSANSTRREIAAWLDSEGIMPVSLMPSMSLSMSISIGDSDEAEHEDLFSDIGEVTELDAIVREIGGLNADWIYFLRLSNDGRSIWVSSYSGLIVRVSRNGQTLDAWVVPTAIGDLVEIDGRFFATQQAWFTELVAGKSPSPICKGFGYDSMLGGRFVSKRYERDIVAGDLLTGRTKAVTLNRDFRASYPSSTGVRIETTTTFLDIDI